MTATQEATQEKVGVLLVHGIGEQSQFEHLEGEARNLATALQKAAAETNRNYLTTKLQEWKEGINNQQTKLILNNVIKAGKQGKVKSAIAKLVQKQEPGLIGIPTELTEAVAELPDEKEIKKLSRWELTELAAKKLAGKARTVRVMVNAFPSAAFGAKQESWHDGGKAPVMVEVYDYDYREEKLTHITKFHFHQVWWADLDERPTLLSEIRFWLWGLSLWTIEGKSETNIPGSKTRMKLPKDFLYGKKRIFAKISLFWVSLVILLILPVLSLLNFVLRQLLGLKIPPPDILSRYIGDVKLFQQANRIGKSSLRDLGSAPRVTLRRRMIQGIVKMSLRPYDRWYILAHSQGTVLAFNGIMETAQSLPNYLTKELWQRCKCTKRSLIRPAKTDHEKLNPEEKQTMSPAFPSWRDKEFILDRKELFKNCKGLLTYGSPLSKFAALWPVIVPLNKQDSHVFQPDFQWLNVYDPTDPVAGETQAFHSNTNSSHNHQPPKSNYKAPEPIDIAYKADYFHLLSHTQYLTFSKCEQPRLVDVVAQWLLEDNLTVTVNKDEVTLKNKANRNEPILTIKRDSRRWPKSSLIRVYQALRIATWLFVALFIGSLLGVLISAATPKIPFLQLPFLQHIISFASRIIPWSEVRRPDSWIADAILGSIDYIWLAALIVLIIGIIVKLWKIATNSN